MVKKCTEVKFEELDELHYERELYAGELVDHISQLEYHMKHIKSEFEYIRKIIGYSIVNETLNEYGFDGPVEEWNERRKKPCDLYFILNEDKDLVKIGISQNANARIKSMQTATGYYLELLNVINFEHRYDAQKAETYLHKKYSEFRRTPIVKKTSEWFDAKIIDDLMQNFNTVEKIQNAINKELEDGRVWFK